MSITLFEKPKPMRRQIADLIIGGLVHFRLDSYNYDTIRSTISGHLKKTYPERVFSTEQQTIDGIKVATVTRKEDEVLVDV